jgi:hypothetical protein
VKIKIGDRSQDYSRCDPAVQALQKDTSHRTARHRALAELKKMTGARTHVCINPNTDEPFSGDRALRERFKSDCLKFGVRYRDVRLLRHGYASWALEAGESVLWVSRQMGHASVEEVLRTYARYIPENLERHGQKLQKALRENRDLAAGACVSHHPIRPSQTRISILRVNAFSAACAVDAAAVAPGRFGIEMTYCPLDCSTLPE